MATRGPSEDQEQRGSQKLLAHLAKNGQVPSLEEIKKALALPADPKLRIPNWLIRGIPPAYLEVVGTLECSVDKVADVVSRFVKLNDSTISLKVLINGIPFPDVAQIVVRNVPGEE
jgi:hypothetical protein